MSTHELSKEGFTIRGGFNSNKLPRNAKSVIILERGQKVFISWSFDKKDYTYPTEL